ncbi:amino acid aminotransferase [Rubellimicrobium sp. CFH 75288]|uniref:amino acid aminotransferase n=1 Tax=Rubellimicrobium sp. CFH 75288 TaxID=2697034 RepID=UPI0014128390|nr:amino acid aminotransferase [Rubellimicrobium sp. CFH 75288]NAZ37678.1 aminotransferase class I/II-fold pyridoxal phosphate-dependent enzyme [Rubellimicrobium sp. CFH 75288]
MLDRLPEQPPDAILSLMAAFRADPRADKIDLGVGVYRDAEGRTPIMRAVREAERRIWEGETTKTYTALAGDPAFADALIPLVLDGAAPRAHIAAAATPGGTGAVRLAFELARMARPDLTVWVPDPTWPNHLSILRHLGIPARPFRYFDPETRGVDAGGMLADLGGVAEGDAVLLHGCCHNPTGADPDAETWAEIDALLRRRGALPLVDLAYLGFGEGLEADAAATRRLAASGECLIALSCSKNFGIYRERAGLLMAVGASGEAARRAQGALAHLNRQTYSFPPDHGARIVSTVLGDAALRAEWEAELAGIRDGMAALRSALAAELRRLTNDDRFDFLRRHRGMFSRLGATPEQVARMREDHGIYMVGDGRVNIAGLNPATVPVLARAMVETGL